MADRGQTGGYRVGPTSGLYEDGDQKNAPRSEIEAKHKGERYEEGVANSHQANDSKDERTIANRLAAEERRGEEPDDLETALAKKDPTAPARSHGNEPSRGAKIDAEIKADEEAELKRKGKA